MNITTHLQFGDNVSGLYNKDYLVVEVRTHFSRLDDSYHPVSLPKCDSIDVTVVAPDKKDLMLQEWFYNNSSYSGRIVFEMADITAGGDNVQIRTLIFNEARCYCFGERYDIDNRSLRLFEMKIKMDGCMIEHVPFDFGSY